MLGRTFGTAAWQLEPTSIVTGPGVLTMVGGVASTTFSETLVLAVLPDASVTVTAIEYWPGPTAVPAAGTCVKTNSFTGVQLSAATMPGRTLGTMAWQLASAESVMGPGALIIAG